jgi:hypothetical protein
MSEQESDCGSSQDDPSCKPKRRKRRTELDIFQHLELALMIASTDKKFTIDEVTTIREARHQTLYKLQEILSRKDVLIKELRQELQQRN